MGTCAPHPVAGDEVFWSWVTSPRALSCSSAEAGVGLGIGLCSVPYFQGISGIFVHTLSPGSVAHLDGRLRYVLISVSELPPLPPEKHLIYSRGKEFLRKPGDSFGDKVFRVTQEWLRALFLRLWSPAHGTGITLECGRCAESRLLSRPPALESGS